MFYDLTCHRNSNKKSNFVDVHNIFLGELLVYGYDECILSAISGFHFSQNLNLEC